MKFYKISPNGVRSEEGIVVQFVTRTEIEYRQNNKIVSVVYDMGKADGKYFVNIFKDAFSNWNDGTSVPTEHQQPMLDNFVNAMSTLGLYVIVDQ